MGSIADIYNTPESDSSSHLLSARSGALNVTQNMIPRSGYAAPLVAGLAGAQAGEMENDTAKSVKTQQFLGTFQKLAKVSKGAAVKFFNENSAEVGIKSPIDGVEVLPDITSVHFENGYVMGYGAGGLYKPDTTGKGWTPVSDQDLKDFRDAEVTKEKTKATKSGSGEADKTKVRNTYAGLRQKQATMKANLGATNAEKSPEYQKLERQAGAMEKDYKWLLDKEATPPAKTDRPLPTF